MAAALRRADALGSWSPDVVKVAHHGSANRDDGLLQLVHAPVAVVSVGAGNDYGHPAPSTVEELERLGYRVLRTDLSGDVATGRLGDGPVLVTTRGP
jgi:competence protein ComEC